MYLLGNTEILRGFLVVGLHNKCTKRICGHVMNMHGLKTYYFSVFKHISIWGSFLFHSTLQVPSAPNFIKLKVYKAVPKQA